VPAYIFHKIFYRMHRYHRRRDDVCTSSISIISCAGGDGVVDDVKSVAKNAAFSPYNTYARYITVVYLFLLLMFPSSMSADRIFHKFFFLYSHNIVIIIYSAERALLRQMTSRVQSVIILPFAGKRHCSSSKSRARH